MKLSNQAQGALMMALQKCLLEEIDIIPILADMDFVEAEGGELIVENPPFFKLDAVEEPNA
jgi:hypothetical protein